MVIEFRKGDILKLLGIEYSVMFHQCNCTAGLGAGIALQIKNKFPDIEKKDKTFRSNNAFNGFGHSYIYKNNNIEIVNMYTQYYTGAPSNRVIPSEFTNNLFDDMETRISKLKQVLRTLNSKYYNRIVAMPLIASGLAKDAKYSHLTDRQYFDKFIFPIIEDKLTDLHKIIIVEYGTF